jgi:thymidylate synthase (FAD)
MFSGAAETIITEATETALQSYNQLINLGVAKEVARFILPLSTRTTLYSSGTLRSWIHYLNIRLESHTQQEHRHIAEQIAIALIDHFPHTTEALNMFNNMKGGFVA